MKKLIYFTFGIAAIIPNVNAQVKSSFSATGDWRAVFQPACGEEIPINFDIHIAEDGSCRNLLIATPVPPSRHPSVQAEVQSDAVRIRLRRRGPEKAASCRALPDPRRRLFLRF